MAKELVDARSLIRMWMKIAWGPADTCWEWTAATNSGEYDQRHGRFRIGTQEKNTLVYPHIVIWELDNEESVPDGKNVLHSRSCVSSGGCCNPDHLRIGSQKENMEDASVTGRISHGEGRWSAKLTDHDISVIRERGKDQSYTDIARDYPVSPQQIRMIAQGKAWKHVQ